MIVRRFDGALGIVKDDPPRHASKGPKGIFKGSDETLGVLTKYDFGIPFSRVTQDRSKDVGAAERSIRLSHFSTGFEVDLQLFVRCDFHSAKGQ